MTNKEAKGNLMYALKWNDMPEKEALKIAIKALDNENVLNKIRAEIQEELKQDNHSFYRAALEDIVKIIDRYRNEVGE